MTKEEATRLLEDGELLYSDPFFATKSGPEIRTDCPDGCCELFHRDIDDLWAFRDDWVHYEFPVANAR